MIERQTDAYGRTIVKADTMVDLVLKGIDISNLLVEGSPIVDEYNSWCRHYDKIPYLLHEPTPMERTPEEEHALRAATWFISDDIQQIDVRKFLLEQMCQDDACRDRVNHEMDLFEERGLVPLLQLMMFLVDHFRAKNVVWGVGRGSSVASYVLFLIGVHKIDAIKYGLDVHDFLK
jgi:DNA polymerase III alpha subunit